ncbi:porin [Acetobacter sp. LMG 1636]|uniref:Porin n=2 Tax=Acetobacter fallax TaxID=1737473 RepID=A0ABX0K3X1_9PROT|nr:porin [Acetobacter fallax]NHO34617.1 porin [Acetobacter fallax]
MLTATVLAGLSAMTCSQAARADDYTDLLDILRAKGSLTKGEYGTLLTKHLHHSHPSLDRDDDGPARSARGARGTSESGTGTRYAADMRHARTHDASPDVTPVFVDARDAANNAAASARSAHDSMLAAQQAVHDPGLVHVAKYVPGKGLTFQAGEIAINLSGFVNGFYTYNSPSTGQTVAGGVSTGAGGNKFDASAVRNGLLPAGLITKITTTQEGIDLAAVFGMYPGIDNATNGAFNANTGGSPVGLGTAGLDFRQIYITAGNKKWGTFKVGRDIALFGSDAILFDATLLSVGSTGSNAAPGNTSLGRIGVGYVYADWIPQISYASPVWHGLQGSVGIFQPLDEFNFAGDGSSATSTYHSSPMVQGKFSYDFTAGDLKGRIWAGFLAQHQQRLTSSILAQSTGRGATVEAGEIGTKLSYKGFEGVAYYYRGSGLGTTGLFFDGIAADGRKRDSEGFYVQGAYSVTKRLRLVGSYGVSNLYQGPMELDPDLVKRNESEVGALFYKITDWLQLVGEYAHTESSAHNGNKAKDNSASGGAVLFF